MGGARPRKAADFEGNQFCQMCCDQRTMTAATIRAKMRASMAAKAMCNCRASIYSHILKLQRELDVQLLYSCGFQLYGQEGRVEI